MFYYTNCQIFKINSENNQIRDYLNLEIKVTLFALGRFFNIPDLVRKSIADSRDFVARAVAL